MSQWTHADTLRQAAEHLQPSRDEARQLIASVESRRQRPPRIVWFGAAAGVALTCAVLVATLVGNGPSALPGQRAVMQPEPEVCPVWLAHEVSSSPLDVGRYPVCETLAG